MTLRNPEDIMHNGKTLSQILADHKLWLSSSSSSSGGERANLMDANLTDADLRDAVLTRANLTRANLTDANLTRANLTWAYLTDANLTRANLTWAYLTDADLTRADLRDAVLTRADLTRADLTRAVLWGTAGNGKEIVSIQAPKYPVAIDTCCGVMQIGYQRHEITSWFGFDETQIAEMDRGALEWWRVWKPIIQQIVAATIGESK